MPKVVVTNVENLGGNPNSAALAINENVQRVADALENTLSRDGTGPNQMEALIDMNGFRIINLGAPEQLDDAVRLRDLTDGVSIEGTAPVGGTTGQVLTKVSNDDYDYEWQDPGSGYTPPIPQSDVEDLVSDLATLGANIVTAQSTADTAVSAAAAAQADATSALSAIADLSDTTLLTENNETAILPNSRRLTAGDNITFDDSASGIREINASAVNGALQFVTEAIVTGSAATNLTVSGLDLSTDECYEIDIIADNATASLSNIAVYFNGDTTATNYDRRLSQDGGAATAANDALSLFMQPSSTSFYHFTTRLDFDGRARSIVNGNTGNTTAVSGQVGMHLWRTVSNVTSITLNSSVANALSVGSVIRIWRRLRVTGTLPPVGTQVAAVQANDLVITSNAVFQDTDVTTPLTAGVWLVTFDILQTQNATPDMQTELTYTGTVTSVAGVVFRQRGNGTAQSIAAITALPYQTTETTTDSVYRRGSFRITVSTSGSLKWRARQDTSSATSVTWHGGNSMHAIKTS